VAGARVILSKVLSILLLGGALVTEPVLTDTPVAELVMLTVGFVLLLVAAVGRTWCSLYIAGRKNAELVTSGPYSMMRHPLYFFSLVGFLGAGLALELVTVALGLVAVFALTHWPTMAAEEAKLARRYGEAYAAYASRVGRFLPNPRRFSTPTRVDADTATFARAMIEAALIMLAFLLALIIDLSREQAWLPTFFILP
jgi:protein-S-isoprenylcysteine O-methyltransferase Ste14